MAAKKQQKTCKYPHCKHESKLIPIGEEVNAYGNVYMHADCNEDRLARGRIIDIWKESIDPHPIMNQVSGIINQVLEDPQMSAKHLEFNLIWCLGHGWHIKRPAGLRYVAKCDEANAEWKKKNTPKIPLDTEFKIAEEVKAGDFVYKPQTSGFNKVLKMRANNT